MEFDGIMSIIKKKRLQKKSLKCISPKNHQKIQSILSP